MATIEPLNSVMTYQAQAVTKPQPAAPVNTEVPEDGQAVNVDATTAAVVKPQAEDEKGRGGDNADSQQQPGAKQSVAQQTDQLKKAIAEMNKKINNTNEEAVFGVHEDTNRIMIKIMDKDTKEVIKEFPPEKTLDMIARIWEMAGILVDEKR
ncbi:MAG: flagellar protein FlaG [Bacteroidales bacterium]|nr:flagellar protein FlaG [Bacteroidales bacterium]MCM1415888.1 flagellar protein FlaG [bacterium]MCM1422682.1 flagellar protein FlaG [bacterium]